MRMCSCMMTSTAIYTGYIYIYIYTSLLLGAQLCFMWCWQLQTYLAVPAVISLCLMPLVC